MEGPRALQEWGVLSTSDKSTLERAVTAMRNRLDPCSRALAAQDFRHAAQRQGESVADFIRRLEQMFKLAYGRDKMSDETRETLLHSQLQEGLLYELMKAPAVSGSHGYPELCLAARNEERRLAELAKRRQYLQPTTPQPTTPPASTMLPTPPPSTHITSGSRQGDSAELSRRRIPNTQLNPGSEPSGDRTTGLRRCYSCGRPGHISRDCPDRDNRPSNRDQGGGTRQVWSSRPDAPGSLQQPLLSPALTSYLLSSSSDEEDGVCQIRISDSGSCQQHVHVLLGGVPACGVIDSGADITIIGSELFRKVAAATRMKKKQLQTPDRIPYAYDRRPFSLDGKVKLDITFDGKTISTPVYIKLDAPEQLLLAEGVCRQLNIITYHPLVSGGKTRKLAETEVPTEPKIEKAGASRKSVGIQAVEGTDHYQGAKETTHLKKQCHSERNMDKAQGEESVSGDAVILPGDCAPASDVDNRGRRASPRPKNMDKSDKAPSPVGDEYRPEKQDGKSSCRGETLAGGTEEHSGHGDSKEEEVKRRRTDGERQDDGGSQQVAKHHHQRQQTSRRRRRRRRGRPCLQRFELTSQDSHKTNRKQSADGTNPATGPTGKIADHTEGVTTSSTGGNLNRTGQDVPSSPQTKNTHMDSGFAGPNQHPQPEQSVDLPDAVVPEATMMRATGSQTTENDWEHDAVVPSVCIRLVQSLRVPPHQSVLAEVQLEDGCCQDTSLLFQHDEALEVLSGLSPDDAVIQPSPDGKSCILISNFTGHTRCLEEGDVIGQATEADVVQNPIPGTPDSISRAFTITTSSESCPDDPQDRHVQRKQKLKEVLVPPKLPPNEWETLVELLAAHHHVFCLEEGDRGETDLISMEIDTGDAYPRRQAPRRMPFAVREEVARQLSEMQTNRVIKPSKSPWASPVVLVRKRDGTHRFCVDYRALNSVTKPDSFPLPRIDELLDQLGKSKYFSTIDLASGFWQIRMHPTAQEKTAFITHQGLYEFRVMPFGLTNAPAVFQRLMQQVISPLNAVSGSDFVSVYLDDILVFSRTLDEHLKHLHVVIQRLAEVGLKLKPVKCRFAHQELEYLGHVVSHNGLKTNSRLIAAVQEFPIPQTVHDVRRFLGLASYYRRFIANFSRIARPLHQLTHKGALFLWSQECSRAFKELKKMLTSAPVLAYPDFKKDFALETDASVQGIGAVLSQRQDDQRLHPIAYASRALSPAEQRYGITELETLAVVWAISHFHHYLYGNSVTVFTDHTAVKAVLETANPTAKHARWWTRVYGRGVKSVKIVYRPGRENANADALSRHPLLPAPAVGIAEDEVQVSIVSVGGGEGVDSVGHLHDVDQLPVSPQSANSESNPVKSSVEEESTRVELLLLQGGCLDVEEETLTEMPVPSIEDTVAMADEGSPLVTSPTSVMAIPASSGRETDDSPSSVGSTHPDPVTDTDTLFHVDPSSSLSCTRSNPDHFATEQKKDSEVREILEYIEGGRVPEDIHRARRLVSEGSLFAVADGILYFVDPKRRDRKRAVVPKHLRRQILEEVHSSRFAGHFSGQRLYSSLMLHWWWRGMSQDATDFARSCPECAVATGTGRRNRPPLQPIPVSRPFQILGIDVMDLPPTERGNRHVVVVQDLFTKWPFAFAVPDQKTERIARLLAEEVIPCFGVPEALLSDRGTNLLSPLMIDLCKMLGIEKLNTTAYHPQCDGTVERFNRTLKTALRKHAARFGCQWDQHLSGILWAYRNTPHSSTGEKPSFLLFGLDCRTPTEAAYLPVTEISPTDVSDYREELMTSLTSARDLAAKAIRKAQARYKYQYDRTARQVNIRPWRLDTRAFSPR